MGAWAETVGIGVLVVGRERWGKRIGGKGGGEGWRNGGVGVVRGGGREEGEVPVFSHVPVERVEGVEEDEEEPVCTSA